MFTSHSACPTTDNPPCVPGTYQVLRPKSPTAVPIVAFRAKVSQVPAKAQSALDQYHRNNEQSPY